MPEPGSPGSPESARPVGAARPAEPVPPDLSIASGESGEQGEAAEAVPVLSGGSEAVAVGVTVAVLATGAAFAAAAGPWVLAGVLLAAQIVLGWAWTCSLGASAGTVVLVAGSALAGDLAVLWPGDGVAGGHGYDDNGIGTVAGVIGVSLAVTVLYQLARRVYRPGRAVASAATAGAGDPATGDPATGAPATGDADPAAARPSRAADRVSGDMAAALGGVAVTAFLTGFLVLRSEAAAPNPADSMVIAGLVGVGTSVLVGRLVATLADLGGGVARAVVLAGAAVGAVAGAGAGALYGSLTDLGAARAAALAAAGAVAAGCVSLLLGRPGPETPSGGPGPETPSAPDAEPRAGVLAPGGALAGVLLGALLPIALAAPMVYLVGRQLPG